MKQENSRELIWRKSGASGSCDCVEVAFDAEHVLIRDSKDPGGAILKFTATEWVAFLSGVRGGDFDLRSE